jgi:pimeloyl-ACP methyl ester carboxylesterase
MPSIPKKNKVLEFFSEQGYWVFFPRYRGTWESDGKFLAKSPYLDIIDIIDGIPKGFVDFWSGEKYKFKPSAVHLFGSSFGGAAVILASQDKRVTKVVALSPVVDWTQESEIEPLDWLGNFINKAFGNAYRFSAEDWKKLESGKFFNPISRAEKMHGDKLFLIHSQDDRLVPYESVKEFSLRANAQLWTLRTQGHLSTSAVLKPKYEKKIMQFFSNERAR